MEVEHLARLVVEREAVGPSGSLWGSPHALFRRGAIRNSVTGYLWVIGAAVMWGTLGIFFTVLHDQYHLSSLAISFSRAGLSALLLVLVLATRKPTLLRVSLRTLLLYAGFGLFGIALFYLAYIDAVLLTNVATASVLLYTAPVFVTLLARGLWREPLTQRKLFALGLAFTGALLVAKAYDLAQLQVNAVGVLVGAFAGFAYALFTIFGKSSSGQSPYTTTAYTFLFGALFLLPLQFMTLPTLSGNGLAPLIQNPAAWPWVLGLTLGPTLGSCALYNAALQRIPASNASVVATVEPMVASLAGFMAFGQVLAPLQIAGELLVLGAALSLSLLSASEPVS
jgi:drug/metabolite transporter, DME family